MSYEDLRVRLIRTIYKLFEKRMGISIPDLKRKILEEREKELQKQLEIQEKIEA